ncbi:MULTISPECIES: cytochrome aa3 quinol oxidase subunit IV [Paenibacillus]|uniref:Quinol oxidase subunit 4 n=1 Tax=Paenibacillus naphthalenovorans TaxID=162209 RepID=A0A0U2M0V3_9BACL|nr:MULTISPECIES: cytochrome aa3 quinol oxidase subunit IV [Paenibacillus]ALS20560.1 subunit IV of cytochrome aa3 quinol oxidase [Paenibacillus naphthalenovorans]NTZ18028.1 cytochrome aa3 quinol oxidase subunit IV [Paenibacillus sp. JMULE4]GCL73117.1 cytochrome aa3 quinol oxidase subunit IV [Paenibacillus naphthalenovorans]SDI67091.1 cytochrome aa3-600 menaquinol oxidase subunit 4 [Paenibacillus naphthalenovorans]
MDNKAKGFPLGHVFGFILSLVLTFAAAGVALKTSLPFHTIMWIIGTLAVIQAGLQLFMFMHVNEGEDRKSQLINIFYGIFMAIIIVLGTIWVMSFGDHIH